MRPLPGSRTAAYAERVEPRPRPKQWTRRRRAAEGVQDRWIIDSREPTLELFVLQEGRCERLRRCRAGETAQPALLDGFSAAKDETIPA